MLYARGHEPSHMYGYLQKNKSLQCDIIAATPVQCSGAVQSNS
jgi:hypothetical protein